jgi:hypothetical protein
MKQSKKQRTSSISNATSYEEMGEYWDAHELPDDAREVEIKADIKVRRHYVSVEPNLMIEIAKEAASKGISSQSLVNLLIQEHVSAQKK